MSASDLIDRLRRLDVRIWLEGDRLRVNAPPGVLTPELKNELAAARDDLIALLRAAAGEAEAITPIDRSTAPPLSYAQERMWLLHQMEPEGAAYHVVKADWWQGPLDTARLERAWRRILDRHEMLRARIVAVDGMPQLVIDAHPQAEVFVLHDLSMIHDDAEARALTLIDEAAHRPFDLAAGPLASLLAVRVGPERHAVVLRFHHAVVDQWALGIVDHELRVRYTEDEAARPAPPAVAYVDFAAWQRARLSGARWDRLLAYWRDRLGGVEPLELPPMPAGLEEEDGQVAETIPADLIGRIGARAAAAGATPYMAMLAVFAAIVYRYTGRSDIPVATPIAGRDRRDLEEIVGVFINTLVVRVDVRPDDTFLQLLGRVREAVLEAFAHQDAPFERLVQELAPQRTGGAAPLAQIMFNMLNQPAPGHVVPGVGIDAIALRRRAAALDLSLIVDPHDRSVMVEYRGAALTRAGALRLLDQYLHLLDVWASDPAVTVAGMPLLHDVEREMLRRWNDTDVPYDANEGVERFVSAQAQRSPDATAVVAFDGALSYADLEALSDDIAGVLRDEGVGPDVVIGVCLERSTMMVAALLGILKAGGAYLPLDPAFPPERLAWMVEDSAVRLILTDSTSEPALPASPARRLHIDVPAFRDRLAQRPAAPLPATVGPEHLAYVLYTSGSTGRPKGVEIPRRALTNFILSMARRPGMTRDDVLLAVTTLSFDIAGLELFLPLVTGARIELATRDEALDGRRLIDRISSRGVTVLQATPATWRLLIDSGWSRTPGLRAFCGGEALTRPLADRMLERCDEVWNLYGPTETTIWSTVERVTAEGTIMIGQPIANTRIHVVGAAGALAPIGVPGELCIAGDGLARGYRNRPELTAERFVPDPFSDRPGGLMYRTGDLARWYPEGRLECLGRMDHQVKVRGFRIELGEIEAVLARHGSVRQAVAAVFDQSGDGRLAAWVVPHDGQLVDDGALRAFLRQELPEYMIPSVFVPLQALPLTANGKIDRKALPHPAAVVTPGDGPAKPVTPLERSIAAIWAEVLGATDVPADATFFDLGGHSLLVARVRGRLEQHLARPISMADLFQHATVRALAAHLEDQPHQPIDDAPIVRRVERRRMRSGA